MRLLFGLCALTPLSAALFAQAPADSIRLSRRQAIAQALVQNAQVAISQEQVLEARAHRVSAIAIPDPQLSVAYDQLPGPFTFGTAPSKPLALGMTIPFPDFYRLNNRIGWSGIQQSQSNLVLQRQTVALLASASYDTLLVAFAHRVILREARDLATDFLKRTQIRYDAGTAAKLDVVQAQVALAQANNDLISNEGELGAAEASMSRALGRVTGPPIAPTDSLIQPPPLPDSSSIVQIALQNRPEISNVRAQQLGAQATTGLAREFWLPSLTFALQHDLAQPGAPLFTTGIAFPLPAFYWSHARGDIAAAQHFERELEATYRDTRAQVVQDVVTSYVTASTAMRQVDFLRDELVPAARQAYQISSSSYSLGGSSALEVLTARQALLQAESQLVDALGAANTARATLDRSLGLTPMTGAGAP